MSKGAAAAILAVSALLTGCRAQPAPAVQAAASVPDLSGVWMQSELGDLISKDAIPLQPWAAQRTKVAAAGEDPESRCFPPGVPRIYLHRYPFEILQVKDRVLLFYEYDHFVRQVWTDGRKHPAEEELDHTWSGHSIGHWDGDTLVVDTVGLNDKTWLDNAGHPHSDALHVVERMRRTAPDALQIDFTFEDPKAYTKPWTGRKVFRSKPGWQIAEQVCADNFLWKEPGK
jgi:hypothetical protein